MPDDIDNDLVELTRALSSQCLDKNADGWFSIPWRNGWFAAELALLAFWRAYGRLDQTSDLKTIATSLADVIRGREESAEVYWRVGDWLALPSIYPSDIPPIEIVEGDSSIFLRAALRCVQVVIAHSDAGGVVYNAILRNAFEGVLPDPFVDIVEDSRARDALCDEWDETKRRIRMSAFRIAWRRGLYKAAYAV